MHSKACWGVWGLMLVLASTSCGGRSEGDTQKPGSAGAPNGGASNVAGAGSAGGPSRACPVDSPSQGDACNHEGRGYCSYAIGECSYVNFECIMGRWVAAPQTDGAANDCNSFYPPNAPNDGDSCKCLGKLDCLYTDCAERGQIHAICDNTTWHVEESACAKQPCGSHGLYCEPGSVCVVHAGRAPQFECALNPCTSTPTSCDCAAKLCGGGEECVIDSGAVACFCPTC